jgi:hypothetical protein
VFLILDGRARGIEKVKYELGPNDAKRAQSPVAKVIKPKAARHRPDPRVDQMTLSPDMTPGPYHGSLIASLLKEILVFILIADNGLSESDVVSFSSFSTNFILPS